MDSIQPRSWYRTRGRRLLPLGLIQPSIIEGERRGIPPPFSEIRIYHRAIAIEYIAIAPITPATTHTRTSPLITKNHMYVAYMGREVYSNGRFQVRGVWGQFPKRGSTTITR